MKILKTLSRLYIPDLNPALEFYEELLGTPATMRFKIPQIGLELAQVGDILLIAGSDEALKPFRSTQATFLVDSLDDSRAYLEEKGAEIIRGPVKVPTGRNMTVRHPDGAVVEYVEHSKSP
ncbi:glyoxalase [Methanosarcina sp. 2.H.T.1A.6]|uniref:VOC family protein n=1 Tax=unclassified Methanosarcina TaxID=2644672 RepID=UPI00062256F7|nr:MULTISPECIES: VOC family protein [unclassified Methanosarcina]KKG17930.1 glyoxalase [Methanosarcina sp. 2.H.T.1A.15]KKG18451.1 glyoxalase [Methanosarcina sp. 2.H.T.1A.3]KKG20652.1 glyoxalase [Methanosarcina sp. 2.H.T.1A.6]KKG23212.1 glyoxalase [Methanosarcina sp. 2.H.T.1A.8]